MESVIATTTVHSDFLLPSSQSLRNYKLVVLPNGIKCLLISDHYSKIASASVSVGTGSFNDPQHIQGLAHLCEHMLFSGTKEFPDPDTYQHTILSHGGQTNAYTCGEQTCFMFEIPATNTTLEGLKFNFQQALHIFSSFFKHPLFNKNLVDAEISIVNDEHMANLCSDDKIIYHGMRLLASSNHPFSRFATGNTQTLRKPSTNLRKELLLFFDTYYYAENMCLVLKGPQSVNSLLKLAILNFIDVKSLFRMKRFEKSPRSSRNSIRSSISTGKSATISARSSKTSMSTTVTSIDPLFPGKCVVIKSESSKVLLFFPVAAHTPYKDLYTRTLALMVGGEYEGSLCESLVRWHSFATEVVVFSQDLAHDQTILSIDINLTKMGAKKVPIVVSLVFEYFQQVLFSASPSAVATFMKEMAHEEEIAFAYVSEPECVMDETSLFAERLHLDWSDVGTANLVRGFRTWDEIKTDPLVLAESFLQTSKIVLSLKNFNMVLLLNELASPAQDEFYGFEYAIKPIDLEFEPVQAAFLFPPPNKHLPGFVSVSRKRKELVDAEKPPELMDFLTNHEIWFHHTPSPTSTATFMTQLHSPRSPKTAMAIEVMCALLGESLRYKFYSCERITYQWGIFPGLNSTSSFCVTVSGPENQFETILLLVVAEISSQLQNLHLTSYKSFKKEKIAIRNKYKNLLALSGVEKVLSASYRVLEQDVWPLADRIDALDEIDVEYVAMAAKSFRTAPRYTSIFISDNSEAESVFSLAKVINQITKHERISLAPSCAVSEPSSFVVPEGKRYVIEAKNTKDDPMNVLFFYIPLGLRESSVSRSLAYLFLYLLSQNASQELRSKYGLGYGVFSGTRLFRKTVGVHISVASGKYNPYYLRDRVESFLADWKQEIEMLKLQDFRELIHNFLNTLKQKHSETIPTSLIFTIEPLKGSSVPLAGESYLRHKNFWEKIVNRSYRFKSSNGDEEIDTQMIENITKNEFLRFLPNSSVSIMFTTQNDPKDLERKGIQQHTKEYLAKKGLHLKEEELTELLQTIDYDIGKLPKQLFKRFMAKHQAMPYVKSSSLDISKSMLLPLVKAISRSQKEEITSTDRDALVTISEFQRQCDVAPGADFTSLYDKLERIYQME